MSTRPNILFVMADQWRGSAVGYMGNSQVQTPSLDRLAERSLVSENAYTPCPVCSPARASIQTGCYPHRHHVTWNTHQRAISLSEDRETVAESLSEVGYETGYIGKWHLSGKIEDPGFVPPESRRGYDFWKGFDNSHAHFKGQPHFDEEGTVRWETGYQPSVQTDIATDFLQRRADSEDPFFLFLSWGPPHQPFKAPEEYRDRYEVEELTLPPNVPDDFDNPHWGPYHDDPRETLAQYYGSITSLDDTLQRLVDCLHEQGIAEETLIVFTSDHGEHMGSHGRWGKGQTYEESIHVPLLFSWPGEIPPGRQTEGFVNLVDLMPTLISLAGGTIPGGVQGRDLTGYLLEQDDSRDANAALSDSVYLQRARTREIYKEQGAPHGGWRALRTENYLVSIDRDLQTRRLFDLREDPHQLEDLSGADPDEHDVPLNALRERLAEAIIRYDDYVWKAQLTPAGDCMRFDFGDHRVDFTDEDVQRLRQA